ncbi:tautomerase family protein [Clostridium tyrobutyricum]|jgi:4-oxalocrotonate tautomerase|uniref:4-oxalocrotonate tautomerase DmpI n=1 Tax=Clostridium tyrobutyricum TaxID=1519 RepID=UPI00073D350D|nr:4-oxalocrotonate tautomerase DmpI [Clostridium tyrobutyricum]MBV4426595.1 tautomerase family protein [Clostridium tyrobutyricum]MBV4431851.1 tautomerase family protein [Clostridium tyrobutyricum]
MPLIKIEGPKITKEQKEQLVSELVTSASKILNIPEQAFVTLIKENNLENIGSGTQLLSDK